MELLNKKNIIIVASVLAVAGVGTYFYQQSCDAKTQAAKSAFYQVQKTMEAEVAALSEAEKAAGAIFDVDSKLAKTVAALSQSKTFEAAMKLGSLYLEHANQDALAKAVAALKQATEYANTKFQKSSALYLLGTAQERVNQNKEAADSYAQALKQENEGLKNELLLALVRTNMKANNATQAKAYSEQLNKEAPGSRAATEAQKLVTKS